MKSFKKNIYCTINDDCVDCIAHDVVIGTQTWTGCNATTAFYNNGDPIPYVDDPAVWITLTTGAWCWYNNDPANESTYGKLYNWYAVNDPRGIAPTGYHVPSEIEVITLINYLGGLSVAGGKLKEIGFCHWLTPNTDATNNSGFTALPGGVRTNTGNYASIGTYGDWWTSSVTDSNNSRHFYLMNFNAAASIANYFKIGGLSLRFIKDTPVSCPDVTIGTQIWTGCNLDVTTYRNGDPIPEVNDPSVWIGLTTGAWCYYNYNSVNGPVYGKLYNWYAVNDPRGLAPLGYHVPTDTEFTTLTNFLGGSSVAGGPLKESGITHWAAPNVGATNSSGFTGLPGGWLFNGSFYNKNTNGYWWSATQSTLNNALLFGLDAAFVNSLSADFNKNNGLSVRLIKD